jgi:protein required for attachment to host cells
MHGTIYGDNAMKLAKGAWVAVIDGTHGLFLENTGTAFEPLLSVRRSFEENGVPTRELARDRPGRMNDKGGPHKSSMEAADLQRRAEDAFVIRVISELEREASRDTFESVVLVAPPSALGAIRKAVSGSLRPKIVGEIAADYARLPVAEIARAVARGLEG